MKIKMKCGICSRETQVSVLEKFGEYTLWECSVCAGQFWTPMRNPGASWYERDERYSFRNLNPLKLAEPKHLAFLRDLPFKNGKLLDIGMGTGNFLAAATRVGHQCYGIDFDRDAIRVAEESFGLHNVHILDIDGALEKFGPASFDAVTIFEVLEHVDDPPIFVGKIKKLLKPGGYLGISVPYRGTPKFLQPHDLPPRHLSRWDEIAMRNFLQLQRFSPVRIKKMSLPFAYLITKFHFRFRGIFSFNLVQKISQNNPVSRKIAKVQKVARVKDYILFFIPAAILYLALWLIGKAYLGLYTVAQSE